MMLQKSTDSEAGDAMVYLILPWGILNAVFPPLPSQNTRGGLGALCTLGPDRGRPGGDSPTLVQSVPFWGSICFFNSTINRGKGILSSALSFTERNTTIATQRRYNIGHSVRVWYFSDRSSPFRSLSPRI